MKSNLPYYFKEHLSNAAIIEIFDSHWKKIPCLSSPGKVRVIDLERELLDFHVRNGGLRKVSSKAVTKMLTRYSSLNPQKIVNTNERGYWFFNMGSQKVKKKLIKSATPAPIKKDTKTILPKKVFGRGNYFVYVFYDNKSTCKIGKTLNIQQRYETLSTSWSSAWSHPFQVQLKSKEIMKEYEKAIHSVLIICGFYINNKGKKGGNELFKITPKKLAVYITTLNKILNIK